MDPIQMKTKSQAGGVHQGSVAWAVRCDMSPFWKGWDSEAIAARVASPVPKNKPVTGPNGAEHACCSVCQKPLNE